MKRATSVTHRVADYTAISIHALVKRATALYGDIKQFIRISIHALVKRATITTDEELMGELFQSTPS